jgi:hypothetical protein
MLTSILNAIYRGLPIEPVINDSNPIFTGHF